MWEAIAEYADGTSIRRLFEYTDSTSENEQQYEIECWLLAQHENCTWYSVNYVEEGEE